MRALELPRLIFGYITTIPYLSAKPKNKRQNDEKRFEIVFAVKTDLNKEEEIILDNSIRKMLEIEDSYLWSQEWIEKVENLLTKPEEMNLLDLLAVAQHLYLYNKGLYQANPKPDFYAEVFSPPISPTARFRLLMWNLQRNNLRIFSQDEQDMIALEIQYQRELINQVSSTYERKDEGDLDWVEFTFAFDIMVEAIRRLVEIDNYSANKAHSILMGVFGDSEHKVKGGSQFYKISQFLFLMYSNDKELKALLIESIKQQKNIEIEFLMKVELMALHAGKDEAMDNILAWNIREDLRNIVEAIWFKNVAKSNMKYVNHQLGDGYPVIVIGPLTQSDFDLFYDSVKVSGIKPSYIEDIKTYLEKIDFG